MSRGAEALQTRMWELITGVWKEQLEQDLSNLPIQWNKFTACGDGRTKHTHTHTHCVCRGTEDLCICIGFANLCALQDYLVTCAITSSIIYLLTYLLSGAEFFFRSYRFSVSQEIPRIYGTRRFINACTSVRHLFLSWASYPVLASTSHCLKIHLNIVLPTMTGSSKWFFPSGFPTKKLYVSILHVPPITFFSIWSPE